MTAAARPARPPRGLAQKLGAIVLGFEAIVVGLGGLTVFGLRALPAGIEPWWAIVGGAVVAVAMIVTAGLLARRGGVVLGWILQALVLASALLVPAMLVIALIFGGMWAYAMIAGGRVDRASRARDSAPEDRRPQA
ncbi:type VI protein secretion system component VasK [Microbacterium resistens]|uniref:Type VI protein secretion system component VasK n=1 Tax=Microbacterium resistens TaxID=156977 RepID=A0ABU1SHE8_9MICO|nr:DUF4233 domain-containing protein [Microbacterium resistens]MDR6868403.1 type VI protein secretion system component VasK [Microbacterium resistens]